ncbi:MAG: Maf family protein [Candidatus Kapaibacteriota bacterium]
MNIIKQINNSEYKFILASNSPRRKELLAMIGLEFEVKPANIDENITDYFDFSDYVMKLSKQKAEFIAKYLQKTNLQKSNAGEKYIILAADTIVAINGQVLNKPLDYKEAFEMLSLLSNNTHEVYTGFCLINSETKKVVTDFEVTKVTFRELSNIEIDDYIQTGSPMDKAGAYGIQEDLGAVFVSKINGDYYNVVGLPLQKLYISLMGFVG